MKCKATIIKIICAQCTPNVVLTKIENKKTDFLFWIASIFFTSRSLSLCNVTFNNFFCPFFGILLAFYFSFSYKYIGICKRVTNFLVKCCKTTKWTESESYLFIVDEHSTQKREKEKYGKKKKKYFETRLKCILLCNRFKMRFGRLPKYYITNSYSPFVGFISSLVFFFLQ